MVIALSMYGMPPGEPQIISSGRQSPLLSGQAIIFSRQWRSLTHAMANHATSWVEFINHMIGSAACATAREAVITTISTIIHEVPSAIYEYADVRVPVTTRGDERLPPATRCLSACISNTISNTTNTNTTLSFTSHIRYRRDVVPHISTVTTYRLA